MWVRRRCPCKKDMKNPVLSVAVRSPVSAYSTLTVSPSEHSTVPAPKTKGKRKNATAVQSEHVAKKAAEEHYKKAHKRATLLYEEESKKKGGMSASAVREAVLKSHDGFAPSKRTIKHHVRGTAGCSLVKPGAKGKLPKLAFNALCVAFETHIRINQINGHDSDNTKKTHEPCKCLYRQGAFYLRLIGHTSTESNCS